MYVNLLKSKMALKGINNYVQAIADLLGVSRTTASKKLNGEAAFSDNEMKLIKAAYNLNSEDVVKIFLEDPNEAVQASN